MAASSTSTPFIVAAGWMTYLSVLKLAPPVRAPSRGIRMSLTREVTILLKAPPIMTPTAMSMMFPLRINALNSFITLLMLLIGKASNHL